MTRFKTALAFIIGIGCFAVFIGCTDSDTHEALSLGAELKVLYATWVKDGRPEVTNVNKYISSNRATFFVYTNKVQIGTNVYHCRFGARSSNFRRNGLLTISDEKVLIWVGNDGSVIVNPQDHPKFEH